MASVPLLFTQVTDWPFLIVKVVGENPIALRVISVLVVGIVVVCGVALFVAVSVGEGALVGDDITEVGVRSEVGEADFLFTPSKYTPAKSSKITAIMIIVDLLCIGTTLKRFNQNRKRGG